MLSHDQVRVGLNIVFRKPCIGILRKLSFPVYKQVLLMFQIFPILFLGTFWEPFALSSCIQNETILPQTLGVLTAQLWTHTKTDLRVQVFASSLGTDVPDSGESICVQ
jgi:hypothetical protein